MLKCEYVPVEVFPFFLFYFSVGNTRLGLILAHISIAKEKRITKVFSKMNTLQLLNLYRGLENYPVHISCNTLYHIHSDVCNTIPAIPGAISISKSLVNNKSFVLKSNNLYNKIVFPGICSYYGFMEYLPIENYLRLLVVISKKCSFRGFIAGTNSLNYSNKTSPLGLRLGLV